MPLRKHSFADGWWRATPASHLASCLDPIRFSRSLPAFLLGLVVMIASVAYLFVNFILYTAPCSLLEYPNRTTGVLNVLALIGRLWNCADVVVLVQSLLTRPEHSRRAPRPRRLQELPACHHHFWHVLLLCPSGPPSRRCSSHCLSCHKLP